MTDEEIWSLDPSTYQNHPLHHSDRDWQESNCYVDVWIEALHALGLEVYACLPFTLASDFEDDQWTFYKPPHTELGQLYGLDVQELTLWRDLVSHCVDQTAAHKLVFVEMDAFHLPDTVGTDYHQQHTKTTIAVARIDASARTLGYFHNKGYYDLGGDDFEGVFKTGDRPAGDLPPYAEWVRIDRLVHRPEPELVAMSLELARHHLRRAPTENPLHRFADRFPRDLEWLLARDLAAYHMYVFAGVRQCGSSFDLGAHYLRWLAERGHPGLAEPAAALARISSGCKTLILKLARICNRKRPTDLTPDIRELADAWDLAMRGLRAAID
jgi:hypothetical protein